MCLLLMESNKKYTVIERLPSLDVDKALLKSIENYFFKNIPNLIDTPGIKGGYLLRIVDVDNELTLDSIDAYELDLLPSGTTQIRVNFRSYNRENNTSSEIQIRFGKERFSSKVELEITCPNPKEVATAILTSLREIFDQKINYNWLFQPTLKTFPIMLALMLGMAYLSRYVFRGNIKWDVIGMIFNLLIVSYLFLFTKWKPYVSFDSRVQRNYDKWAGVFLWGIPPFILFGVALPKIIDFLSDK